MGQPSDKCDTQSVNDAERYRPTKAILELAAACGVPYVGRAGWVLCHHRESGLVSGEAVYGPKPVEASADGNAFICFSQPTRDVVIDL
jgi:hypothetical protein